MKKILITGASSGFGKAIAEKFASSGYEIIITGRRENLLNKLKEYQFPDKTKIYYKIKQNQTYEINYLNEITMKRIL